MTEVTIYHLEMHDASELKARESSNGLVVQEACIRQYQYNRFLYQLVGENWQWHEKLLWSTQQWQDYAEREQLRTWSGFYQGSVAGYFELEQQPENTVELKYFGLAPMAIGKGFGRYFLSQAITRAWQWGQTERVWVHTCSLDHPNALGNYKACGFSLFKTEIVDE